MKSLSLLLFALLFEFVIILAVASKHHQILAQSTTQPPAATCESNPMTFTVPLNQVQSGSLLSSSITNACPNAAFSTAIMTTTPLLGRFSVSANGDFTYTAPSSGAGSHDNILIPVSCPLESGDVVPVCTQNVVFNIETAITTTTTIPACPSPRYTCYAGESIQEQLSAAGSFPSCLSGSVTFAIVTPITFGTLNLLPNGDFTYTASKTAKGYDNFDYSATCSGVAVCTAADVAIYVTDAPPPTTTTPTSTTSTSTTTSSTTTRATTTTTSSTAATTTRISTTAKTSNSNVSPAPPGLSTSTSSTVTSSPNNTQMTSSFTGSPSPTTNNNNNNNGNAPPPPNADGGDTGGNSAAIGIVLGVVGGVVILGVAIAVYRKSQQRRSAIDGEDFSKKDGGNENDSVAEQRGSDTKYRQFEINNKDEGSSRELETAKNSTDLRSQNNNTYSPVAVDGGFDTKEESAPSSTTPREVQSTSDFNRH